MVQESEQISLPGIPVAMVLLASYLLGAWLFVTTLAPVAAIVLEAVTAFCWFGLFMVRPTQAKAILAARTRIVQGAANMVEIVLEQLSHRQVVQLDEERKAAMVNDPLVMAPWRARCIADHQRGCAAGGARFAPRFPVGAMA